MARHAIVDPTTNEVINVVIWEGTEWLPPKGKIVIQHDSVNVGDIYDPVTSSIIRVHEIAPD